jgi:hypothetical protein
MQQRCIPLSTETTVRKRVKYTCPDLIIVILSFFPLHRIIKLRVSGLQQENSDIGDVWATAQTSPIDFIFVSG